MSYEKNIAMGTDEFEAFVETYITVENCEFPVKRSSKRSKMQRKKAAKKNRFPVGMRKSAYSDNRDRAYMAKRYHKKKEKAFKKILPILMADAEYELKGIALYGDPYAAPYAAPTYVDNLYYEYYIWKCKQKNAC